jgi:broad specificity phosphatase PhoE
MIFFVRHGETDDNINGYLLTGHNDVELNENGIRQAKELAEQLKIIEFDLCYCSSLKRAKQTLDEILKYHPDLQVFYDDRIRERDYGEATGQPASVCKFRRWNINDVITFKNFETIPHMFERISSFYDEILLNNQGKNILVVAHSGVGRMSCAYFNGHPKDGDYSKFYLDNAELTIFDELKKPN